MSQEPTVRGGAWRPTMLPVTATMQDAITSLERSGLQIVLVAGAGDVLVGTVTDGDIRRGLLRGLGLSSPIESLVTRNPMVVPPAVDHGTVLQLMRANGIMSIPIVDDQRRVVGLHLLNELIAPPKRENLMVIMAGGVGTRLRPHTEHCPKPLLPVAGKPMMEHIIERARADGFQRFVVSVNYLGHMIEEHFGNGSRWQVEITYLREDTPLGTAGALRLMSPPPSEPFLVSNGDVMTDIRYGELLRFHTRHSAAATMAVRLHEWQHPYGVVHINGVDIVGFDEKPVARTHINAGVYALDPAALEQLEPSQRCDMPALFARLKQAGLRTIVYPMHEPWLDVGHPADYAAANDLPTPVSTDAKP